MPLFPFTEVESPNEFYPLPPPYSVATSLPTYDEAEKAKAAAMAAVAAEATAQRVSEPCVLTHSVNMLARLTLLYMWK